MGVFESAGDGFVGLDNAETRLSADALERRRRLTGRIVMGAVVVTQLAWFLALIVAARHFVF